MLIVGHRPYMLNPNPNRRGQLEGVIRSQGIIWVATHPEDRILWNQARAPAVSPVASPGAS